MLSPQRVAQGSAARNERTNALHASVVKGWSVYEFVSSCLTVLPCKWFSEALKLKLLGKRSVHTWGFNALEPRSSKPGGVKGHREAPMIGNTLSL